MSTLKPRAFRIIGAFSAATLWSVTGCAAEPPPPDRPTPTPPAQAAAAPRTDAEQRAIDRAQQALEEKQQWIPGLAVESITATDWSDSSLGCRKPGVSYMQVITSGYTVKFVGKDARQEVHVTDKNAVVCTGLIRSIVKSPTAPVRYRNLDEMVTAARADLAAKLGATPESIKLVNWTVVQLPAAVLRCEAGAADLAAPAIPGYKLQLAHQGRIYTYHSDTKTAVACPAIERQ